MDKIEKYRLLTEQIRALIDGEKDSVAVMANVCAAIHEAMGFWWTGFYRVKDGELVLGPFQGPVACMHIGYGKGVCGTAWKERVNRLKEEIAKIREEIADMLAQFPFTYRDKLNNQEWIDETQAMLRKEIENLEKEKVRLEQIVSIMEKGGKR